MALTKEQQEKLAEIDLKIKPVREENAVEGVFDTSEEIRASLSSQSQVKLDLVCRKINMLLENNNHEEASRIYYKYMPDFLRESGINY
jgi:hypothetical protein